MESHAAADALRILREGEQHVRREARRERALRLGGQAVTGVLWLGRKDLRDPVRRRAVGAVAAAGMVGLALWEFDRSRVGTLWAERMVRQRPDLAPGETERRDPSWSDDHPSGVEVWRTLRSMLTPRGQRMVALSAVTMLAQPLVRLGFRWSGIRRPHLAAGMVTAAMSTATGLAGLWIGPKAEDARAPMTIEPIGGLHELLHDPTRLGIIAVVAPATSVEARLVRDVTGLSDSALPEQLSTLSDAGIVEVERRRTGPARWRTWINLTVSGRAALTAHTAALTEIARGPSQT